jgi:hypothetical protein
MYARLGELGASNTSSLGNTAFTGALGASVFDSHATRDKLSMAIINQSGIKNFIVII